MAPYWLIFFIPAFAAISRTRRPPGLRVAKRTIFGIETSWFWVVFLLTFVVGLRFEVGGDWFNYLYKVDQWYFADLKSALLADDPGYRFLEWISAQKHWGVYGVNLISAFLFSWGLAVFCCDLPRPWLALAVAMPYMVTVVAMGYTRQGVAMGLAMLGLVALGRQVVWKFVFWVFLAASFHKSAVLLMPIAALAATRKRLWTIFWVAVVVAGAYVLFLQEAVDSLYVNYVEAEYQSQGALIRLLMNAVPSAILLIWWRKLEISLAQKRLWLWFALISLALFGVYFLTPASTAVDRVALYMIPIQLVVFSCVPEVFGTSKGRNTLFVVIILLYYAAVLFVWLNFATHARYWLPYRNALFL